MDTPSQSPLDADGLPLEIGASYRILHPRRKGFVFELASLDPPGEENWKHIYQGLPEPVREHGKAMAKSAAQGAKKNGAVSLRDPVLGFLVAQPPHLLRRS